MKIAITSAPNIDNIELANNIANKHKLDFIADPVPNICQSLGYQTLYNLPMPEQIALRERVMREHLQDLKTKDGVYGYSCIEWLADWMRWAWSHTTTEQWHKILMLNRQIVSQYDQVIWVKNGTHKSYDGYTWLDTEHCNQIASLIPFCAEQVDLTLSMVD